jgi:hypothetical protein
MGEPDRVPNQDFRSDPTDDDYSIYDDPEIARIPDEEKEKAKWVCELCGTSTYEVDYDYIGSGYNHLGCELKIEMAKDRRKKMKDKQNETK